MANAAKVTAKVLDVMSMGFSAMAMVSAVQSKNPMQFSYAMNAFLHDLARMAKIKELDDEFLDAIQPDLAGLTEKIFVKVEG